MASSSRDGGSKMTLSNQLAARDGAGGVASDLVEVGTAEQKRTDRNRRVQALEERMCK